MRVIILTAIGGLHGMGHATRCLALANELWIEHGVQVLFLTPTPGLDKFVSPFPCAHDGDQIHEKLRNDDILVVDFKGDILAHEDYEALRKRGVKIVRIDHPLAKSDSCDLCIIPNAHQAKKLQGRLLKRFGDRLLIGWEYVMLDSEITSMPRIPYEERRHGPIVFCAGGSDPIEALPQMMHALRGDESVWPLQKILAYGSQKAYFLRRGPYSGYGYRCVPFERRMIQGASMVVGMFGQTAYECIYLGTPMLCFGHNAENNYAAVELMSHSKESIQAFAGTRFDKIPSEIFCDIVKYYYDDKLLLEKISKSSDGLIDGLGIKRIANAIFGL